MTSAAKDAKNRIARMHERYASDNERVANALEGLDICPDLAAKYREIALEHLDCASKLYAETAGIKLETKETN